ncbi:hypothetical protein [Rhizobium miluonense]|uniref:Uncharacterized protein n=1 Tax=Rhizobium miluonense TaxID=411945 RepID=A0ABU1STP2_9HYPH|nr:hypothetical protein [Rhizobium miluonense]MDR6902345.1 hypothetical protein [Rhizobium miluonense]
MSEYQNKAVKLLASTVSDGSLMDLNDRRDAFLHRALELYFAAGGAEDAIQPMVEKVYSTSKPRVDIAVGDVLYKLAGIGHACDIDIIQAGYNKLDDAKQTFAGEHHHP